MPCWFGHKIHHLKDYVFYEKATQANVFFSHTDPVYYKRKISEI